MPSPNNKDQRQNIISVAGLKIKLIQYLKYCARQHVRSSSQQDRRQMK